MAKTSSLGNDLYSGRRSFRFVQRRKTWYSVALALIALSFVVLGVRGLNWGIEFTGGSQFTVSNTSDNSQTAASNIMRKHASDDSARVVQVGDSTLRVQTTNSELGSTKIEQVRTELAQAYGVADEDVTSSFVGPTWGQDISWKALRGFISFLVLVAIGLTVYFRSWRNAAGAVLALFNDLIISVGVYAAFGFEVTPATVTGLLTILGYSLYDTVVVFDKVRENSSRLLAQTEYTFAESVNLAVNQMLIRSLNTSITSLLPVAAILFLGTTLLGAGTLRDLSLVMFVGIILSTISSIFIASPLAVTFASFDPKIRAHTRKVEERRAQRRLDRQARIDAGEDVGDDEVHPVGGIIREAGSHQGITAQPRRRSRKNR
ncbi:MAG: protein translocase subunit SecF [Actinomycetaceae bacterium]|nr:protein translocase subunit SecF [Actinomycetaceae bacterium]